MGSIRIAQSDEEIRRTYNVISQLHPNVLELGEIAFVEYVRQLQADFGYRLATLIEDNNVVSVAGFRVCRNLGWGKYLYVDDLVTDDRWRSAGAGRRMFSWIVERARSEECAEVRLDARLDRKRAHDFYLREGMEIVAHHFRLRV
jgi:GNAT superfamily N-acetyltransferase